MKLSDRDAFYETMYFHELAERDRLDDRFRTLLSIVAIVFALIAWLFNTVVLAPSNIPLLFWFMYGLATISFAAAIVCYVKAWHSQYYNAFPMLSGIEQYIEQIREHYRQETDDEQTAEQWTEEAFADYMRQSFIDHASFNVRANDNKRFWLYYGNSFVIAAFAFGVMACFPVADTLLG